MAVWRTGVKWGVPLLTLATACTRAEPPREAQSSPPDGDTDVFEVAVPRDPPALELRPMEFSEGGLALHLVDAAHSTHAWDVGGALTQTIPLGPDHTLAIVVRVGEGEGLAAFRRDRKEREGIVFRRRSSAKVCGAGSSKLEASEPSRFYECVEFVDAPSAPMSVPAETTVALQFRVGELDAIATWSVPTDLRDRYLALETKFFESIRCPQ